MTLLNLKKKMLIKFNYLLNHINLIKVSTVNDLVLFIRNEAPAKLGF